MRSLEGRRWRVHLFVRFERYVGLRVRASSDPTGADAVTPRPRADEWQMDRRHEVSSQSVRTPRPRGARRTWRSSQPRSRRSRRVRRRAERAQRRTIIGRHPFRTAFVVIVLGLTPLWVSLGDALTNPGYGSSLSVRFAEWARQHGAGPEVAWAEGVWYSHHQPPVGGKPAPGAIPAPTPNTPTTVATHHPSYLAQPSSITPFASPPIRGEGDWHPVGRKIDGETAIYETFMRPDAVHTSTVVGVAWMDTRLLKATLYSGSQIPGGGPYPHSAPIRPGDARGLVAAFNAGFLMANANGGYYTDGRAIVPLRTGAASFIIYRNGGATVGTWRGASELTPNVVAVRQNLDLLVKNGKPVPGLQANDTYQWGATLGNQVYVWRSGIGVTADGALVYVGGPGLNITSLANLLVRVGAVRAMEFDINTDWVNFTSFQPSSARGLATSTNATLLLPAMESPDRYFASWWTRDFITMSAHSNGG